MANVKHFVVNKKHNVERSKLSACYLNISSQSFPLIFFFKIFTKRLYITGSFMTLLLLVVRITTMSFLKLWSIVNILLSLIKRRRPDICSLWYLLFKRVMKHSLLCPSQKNLSSSLDASPPFLALQVLTLSLSLF